MSYELIKVEDRGRVGLMTLNRPKQLNALSPALMQEVGSALQDFDRGYDCSGSNPVLHRYLLPPKRT